MASDSKVTVQIFAEDAGFAAGMAKAEAEAAALQESLGAEGLAGGAEQAAASAEKLATTTETRLTKALSNLSNQLPGVNQGLGATGSTMGGLTEGMGAAALAGAAAAAAFAVVGIKSAMSFEASTQAVLKFREVTLMSAEDSSRWVAVAEKMGVDSDQLALVIGKAEKALASHNKVLDQYGISVVQGADGTVDMSATLLEAVGKINGMADATQRAEVASALFGRGWESMSKILSMDAGELQNALAGVRSEQIFNDGALAKGESLRLAMENMKIAVGALGRELGENLAPALTRIADGLTVLLNAINPVLGPLSKLVDLASQISLVGWLGDMFGSGNNNSSNTADMPVDTNPVGDGSSSQQRSATYIDPATGNVLNAVTGAIVQYANGMNVYPGRAGGGWVEGGRPYNVGENGPELFIPGPDGGTIQPNTGGTTVHISLPNVGMIVNQDGLASTVRDALLDFQRRNGSLGFN